LQVWFDFFLTHGRWWSSCCGIFFDFLWVAQSVFFNKTCESFLKVWKLICNQHFLFDVYTLHCCHPCFAWLSINFTFKCFRSKSWPCYHWVKPRSTTCFFQFLITKYDDERWVEFRKRIPYRMINIWNSIFFSRNYLGSLNSMWFSFLMC
jgi:hypothetical protein